MTARQTGSEGNGLSCHRFRLFVAVFEAAACRSVISKKIGQSSCLHRVGVGEIRVERDCRVQQSDNGVDARFAIVGVTLRLGFQEKLLGRGIARAADADRFAYGLAQRGAERCSNALCNVHLDLDRVAWRTVIIL